jgi:23S rRNA pseudouridine2605 synthase
VWITFAIREGKNREVRNVLRHLGLHVARLIRVSFGPFQLGELADGEIAEVPTRVLRDQLGEKLARLAGADFSAPIVHQRKAAVAAAPVPSRNPAKQAERGEKREKPAREGNKFQRPRRGEGARPSFDERAPKRGGRPQRGKR